MGGKERRQAFFRDRKEQRIKQENTNLKGQVPGESTNYIDFVPCVTVWAFDIQAIIALQYPQMRYLYQT